MKTNRRTLLGAVAAIPVLPLLPDPDPDILPSLVSCLCTSRGDLTHLAAALAWFEEQPYEDKELVIVQTVPDSDWPKKEDLDNLFAVGDGDIRAVKDPAGIV